MFHHIEHIVEDEKKSKHEELGQINANKYRKLSKQPKKA